MEDKPEVADPEGPRVLGDGAAVADVRPIGFEVAVGDELDAGADLTNGRYLFGMCQ